VSTTLQIIKHTEANGLIYNNMRAHCLLFISYLFMKYPLGPISTVQYQSLLLLCFSKSGMISSAKQESPGKGKAQLDGAWLGSFYVITDVSNKESYSNARCIRSGAACEYLSEGKYFNQNFRERWNALYTDKSNY
jgi:hypothetical protein